MLRHKTVNSGGRVYTIITNPDTTQAILGWTGVSILLGLLGPVLVGRLEHALRRRDGS
jgi:hypothetical protein